MKQHIDHLKNFGFTNETTVVEVGINGKMNELQAAFGLLQLENVNAELEKRKKIALQYRESLLGIDGIVFLDDLENVEYNYSYFPVFINEEKYGQSRDSLYNTLKEHNIFARRYFYPLISDFPIYEDFSSSNSTNLPAASEISQQVICLPIYAELEFDTVDYICHIIKQESTTKAAS